MTPRDAHGAIVKVFELQSIESGLSYRGANVRVVAAASVAWKGVKHVKGCHQPKTRVLSIIP